MGGVPGGIGVGMASGEEKGRGKCAVGGAGYHNACYSEQFLNDFVVERCSSIRVDHLGCTEATTLFRLPLLSQRDRVPPTLRMHQ